MPNYVNLNDYLKMNVVSFTCCGGPSWVIRVFTSECEFRRSARVELASSE